MTDSEPDVPVVEKKKRKRWLPLESNFNTLNTYLQNLCKLPTLNFQFGDVFGFEDELLSWIPQPCVAFLLLYPITDENTVEKEAQDEEYIAKQKVFEEAGGVDPLEEGVYFIDQTIGNACGTIALLHAVLNCLHLVDIGDPETSPLRKFYLETKDLSPQERAAALEAFDAIEEAHSETAQDSRNARDVTEEDMTTRKHFVAFVVKNGHLWELDGRRAGPLDRGEATPDRILQTSAQVVRHYIDLNPDRPYEFAALSFHMSS